MKLKVVLTPSEDGGYTAYIPALRGCINEGDTREDALANIREALELYLEPIDDDLETISKHLPCPPLPVWERIEVRVTDTIPLILTFSRGGRRDF